MPDEFRVPRQLPLDLGHPTGLSRDDLIVTAANDAAVELVDRWPDWPGPVVVLVGPRGSGKSHLAELWRETAGARQLAANAIGPAYPGEALLIDGIGAGPLDETGLFHLINAVRGGGGHLLLTARSFPSAWSVTLPDLRSRLRAAIVVQLGEPDDALLAAVLVKLFADRQVQVDAAVVQYLVRRMERSLSAATQLVDVLDRASLARKVPVTRQLAADVLGSQSP